MFFNGLILIPLTSLVLLIVSFFAKVPKGVALAATIFGLVVLQVLVLPALSRSVGSGFGALHGVNALVLMGVAIMAGQGAATGDRRTVDLDLRAGLSTLWAAVRGRPRTVVAVVATLAILLPLGWMWNASRLPDAYDMAEMGYPDWGGGPVDRHHGMAGMQDGTPVADLVDRPRPAGRRAGDVDGHQGRRALPRQRHLARADDRRDRG